ncbi:undecaprenyl-diphosphatase [Bacillus sp. ISL-45]|uniref:undecaprenyl-diphosphatase n=1 Tax=Bacillus sp. ISL-45 TaxID=2819128 RepID=UPI001BEA9C5D|nr:undecaprenyl-diphosphatase [Bacillus sp. ISL-45]MBT2660051.1 undecaprenyl-diphosphatase [Bacillus sp. ISL-45]
MDLNIFQLITRFSGHNRPVDLLMIFVSNRIRYVYILITALLLFKNRHNKRIAIETGSSVFISLVIQFFIKIFYYRPRPFKKRRVGILIPSKNDSSFPSKHTILAFAASTTLLMFHRKLGILMTWLSALTGFSRIWVGHHYPSDIIGSALIGSLASFITRIISYRIFGDKPGIS